MSEHNYREYLYNFVYESNTIENIKRAPTPEEIAAHIEFLELPEIKQADLIKLVSILQPKAVPRFYDGVPNVNVGGHNPMPSSPVVMHFLENILLDVKDGHDPYSIHQRYETLHPFTDGNGRSGRALWYWQMLKNGDASGSVLGFLRSYYYQSLRAYRG